jgi:PBP1b-binding outer membrane lipoprotein LpoB
MKKILSILVLASFFASCEETAPYINLSPSNSFKDTKHKLMSE